MSSSGGFVLAGALGGQSRAIYTPPLPENARNAFQNDSRDTLCSVYGPELKASAIGNMLSKFDLIDKTHVAPEKLLYFGGFYCEALGVTAIDLTINAIRKRFDMK